MRAAARRARVQRRADGDDERRVLSAPAASHANDVATLIDIAPGRRRDAQAGLPERGPTSRTKGRTTQLRVAPSDPPAPPLPGGATTSARGRDGRARTSHPAPRHPGRTEHLEGSHGPIPR